MNDLSAFDGRRERPCEAIELQRRGGRAPGKLPKRSSKARALIRAIVGEHDNADERLAESVALVGRAAEQVRASRPAGAVLHL